MSFTTSVKQELNRVSRDRACCRTSELAALFRAAGSFHILGNERYGIHASFALSSTARMLISLVRSFDLPTEIRVKEERRLGPHKRYEIYLEGGGRLLQFLNEIGVISDNLSLLEDIPGRVISARCCRTSFLRGAFVAAGSVSGPGAPAHLEIYSSNQTFLGTVQKCAEDLGLNLKITGHSRRLAAYSKNLKTIGDFLVKTGAHRADLEFEERSIMSRVREAANRRVNFDHANVARSTRAAARQIQAIEELQRRGALDSLNSALGEIAELRLKYPSATIVELGRRANPPLSKSAVNHRLRRLMAMAGLTE